MPNRKHSLVSLPPVPREGQLVLLAVVEGVLGRSTELGRCLTRAIASEDPRDLIEAQSAFDALSAELRESIAVEVHLIVEKNERTGAAADNVIRLRPRAAQAKH
jgi:hypothetical protein